MKYLKILMVLSTVFWFTSCEDESKDPFNLNTTKKGTILALRGTALQAAFINGTPISTFVPSTSAGGEKFIFEAEFLAEDVTTLASVDVYVLRKTSPTASTRVLLFNVPAAQFKKDGKYVRPYTEITITIEQLLTAIGITPTFPLAPATVTTIETNYLATGFQIEADINLTDGTKILAADIIAAGLFSSSQFYPAQRLSWTVIKYCPYVAGTWAGNYDALEVYSNGVYGPYTLDMVQDGGNPNRFNTTNFYDFGSSAFFVFNPSTSVATQTVTMPAQTITGGAGGSIPATPASAGTYDECTKKAKINVTYDEAARVQFRYELGKQ